MERGFGRLELPRDDRDFSVRQLLTAATTGMRNWPKPLVLDQGRTGTCEGNAWTGWLADGPVKHPDIAAIQDAGAGEQYAQDLYVEATGDKTLQKGAYTRQILTVLVGRGLVGAYYNAANVDEVVQTILTVGPVCFGSNWYGSMDTPQTAYGNVYLSVDEASGVRGGHEYLLDGVNLEPADGEPYVRLHNSWGTGWAHGGTARVTLNDLGKLFVGDAFVATELVG